MREIKKTLFFVIVLFSVGIVWSQISREITKEGYPASPFYLEEWKYCDKIYPHEFLYNNAKMENPNCEEVTISPQYWYHPPHRGTRCDLENWEEGKYNWHKVCCHYQKGEKCKTETWEKWVTLCNWYCYKWKKNWVNQWIIIDKKRNLWRKTYYQFFYRHIQQIKNKLFQV